MELDPVQIRVLGCLIEKQRTTPEQYPLSMNALRLACNQATNRDPVVDYDEQTVRAALHALSRQELVRLASGPGSRAVKYRHLLAEKLELSGAELSLLAVLMLRGAQTLGELKQRSERMHRFGSLAEVSETLEALVGRELVRRLPRRAGAREERYEHALAPSGTAPERDRAEDEHHPAPPALANDSLDQRVRRLEEQVAELRRLLDAD